MKLQCPQCNAINLNNSKFCNNCGVRFNVIPKKINNSLSSPVIALIAVISLCSICGLCGLIGNINDKSKKSDIASQSVNSSTPQNQSTETIKPLVSNASNTPIESVKTESNTKSSKSGNSKIAVVISENANLRESADMNSIATQTVAEGAEVEVILQKGAWFLVKFSGQKGWMHGNTIKYKNAESIAPPSVSTETVSRPAPVYKTPERNINPTGATARCRDGTLSYSAHRRGTCSHHGGVAVWY